MHTSQRLGIPLLALAMTMAGCGDSSKGAKKSDPTNLESSGNPLLAPVDYLGAQAKGKRIATKTIGIADVQQAIQKFQAMEERFPASLQELVQQHYLGRIPETPQGFRWIYDPATGQANMIRNP